MSKKHVPVTDMTFGQLYDAVASGEEFYCENAPVIVNEYGYLTAKPLLQTGLVGALIAEQITRLVEAPWTDQLDGTWENGVWCMCGDKPINGDVAIFNNWQNKIADKVVKLNAHGSPETLNSIYEQATPLPQDLADQLEALSKEQ